MIYRSFGAFIAFVAGTIFGLSSPPTANLLNQHPLAAMILALFAFIVGRATIEGASR